MIPGKRQHSLDIWLLGLGYFLFYIPYSGLTKAVTSGLLSQGHPVSVFELLPSVVISTAILVPLSISVMGWWKYAAKRRLLGFQVPFPRYQTFISGIGFAAIILTTTFAYSFSGISIIFALVLMRSGVLLMSPLIDVAFHRRVRWFSWLGFILSLLALLLALRETESYRLSLMAVINLACYLIGYGLRLPCMSQLAKTEQKPLAYRYFVEEQIVAMPALILAPLLFALVGKGAAMHELRFGFSHLFDNPFTLLGLAIGAFYAGLGTFCTFIYLDRRENTFCIPMYSCSSLLSGIVASYLLTFWLKALPPSGTQVESALVIMAALLVLSPIHHLPLYVNQLINSVAEKRLVIVEIVREGPVGLKTVRHGNSASFITVNFGAVRKVLNRGPAAIKRY
jgi:hypothetical protein